MLFIHRVRQSGPLQTGPGGGGGAGGAHSPIDTSAVRTPSAPGGPTVAITATHWSTVFPGKPNSLPAWQGVTLLCLYTFGWAMQLFWSSDCKLTKPRKPSGN